MVVVYIVARAQPNPRYQTLSTRCNQLARRIDPVSRAPVSPSWPPRPIAVAVLRAPNQPEVSRFNS
jgi:hypothetical protein